MARRSSPSFRAIQQHLGCNCSVDSESCGEPFVGVHQAACFLGNLPPSVPKGGATIIGFLLFFFTFIFNLCSKGIKQAPMYHYNCRGLL